MKKIPDNYLLALNATIEAAAEILRIYKKGFHAETKKDGSPVTEADLASSKIINDHLKTTNIPVIGEEIINLPYEERKTWTENWCVDPLDGTKEFLKRNGEFCINIAHVKHEKAVFGIINEPCRERIIFGGSEYGVFIWKYLDDPEMTSLEEIKKIVSLDQHIIWIASRSHKTEDANWVEGLTKSFSSVQKLAKGSAIKFFDLALGNAHIYPRFAPTMEWDIAAGQAILEALGGTVHDAETGMPLHYNKPSLYNPYFVAKTGCFIEHEKKFGSLHSV
jgi:3'(2'), 5'-bisphosphate nucleotidase